jgi:hypothetical protein
MIFKLEAEMQDEIASPTFALDLLQKGVPLEEVSKLLEATKASRPRKSITPNG